MPVKYGTPSGFRTYLTERSIPLPLDADDDAIVDGKLLVASEWLDARYGGMFPGRKTNGRAQDRAWPRTGASDHEGYAIDFETVPVEIDYATYEAARREFNSAGILSRDYTPNKYQRAAVSGAVDVTYTNFNGAQDTQIELQIVNEILSKLLDMDDGNILSGASCR